MGSLGSSDQTMSIRITLSTGALASLKHTIDILEQLPDNEDIDIAIIQITEATHLIQKYVDELRSYGLQ